MKCKTIGNGSILRAWHQVYDVTKTLRNQAKSFFKETQLWLFTTRTLYYSRKLIRKWKILLSCFCRIELHILKSLLVKVLSSSSEQVLKQYLLPKLKLAWYLVYRALVFKQKKTALKVGMVCLEYSRTQEPLKSPENLGF